MEQGLHSLQCIVGAPYKPRDFWEKDGLKHRIADELIERIEKFIPGLSPLIEHKLIATPPTLLKYTSNFEGAMYGWASSMEQLSEYSIQNQMLKMSGLYLVGHWAGLPTGTNGVATVVASGRAVAKRILRAKNGFASFGLNNH